MCVVFSSAKFLPFNVRESSSVGLRAGEWQLRVDAIAMVEWMKMSTRFGYLCSAVMRNILGVEVGLERMFPATLMVGATCGYYPVRISRLIHMGNTAGGVGR
jgi:hypothetical protein